MRAVCTWVMILAAGFGLTNAKADDAKAPLPLKVAANKMSVPTGFHVTLFAGEPDVRQPMAFTIDDRGRLWVIESYSYPDWIRDGSAGRDRILIFEDVDGDGKFDKRTVFWDKGVNLAGLEIGFGGVWLCATPNFLFLPDRNHDDKPDGPPQVLLDGWDIDGKHNVFNGLTWGPDGWLYGCNGILSNSNVGKPNTPSEKRIPFNCGVWRYHPIRHEFEVVAWGTTNPWGLDFDQFGQMFITNCVIKHAFHVVPGAHFVRMFGQDFNIHTYGLIESCADHIHWGGGGWQSSRGGVGIHDKPGGGHAHAGAMIYLGDNWPDQYRGNLFTCNLHGNRVNQDRLVRKGSGYVAQHDRDFLNANDTWFRGLELKYGPDGGVYMTDWCDTGECHDYKDIHQENGRIYKITYKNGTKKRSPFSGDVRQLDDKALVDLLRHKNDWHARHAIRVLQERAAVGQLSKDTHPTLKRVLVNSPVATHRLRALWALHVTNGLNDHERFRLLSDKNELVRAWTIQLEMEDRAASSSTVKRLARLAKSDPSPLVRLYLASGLQRLRISDRWTIAESLVSHKGDSKDANLPLMIWYGIEPMVVADRKRAVSLILNSQIPLLRQYIARRIASLPK